MFERSSSPAAGRTSGSIKTSLMTPAESHSSQSRPDFMWALGQSERRPAETGGPVVAPQKGESREEEKWTEQRREEEESQTFWNNKKRKRSRWKEEGSAGTGFPKDVTVQSLWTPQGAKLTWDQFKVWGEGEEKEVGHEQADTRTEKDECSRFLSSSFPFFCSPWCQRVEVRTETFLSSSPWWSPDSQSSAGFDFDVVSSSSFVFYKQTETIKCNQTEESLSP